MNTRKAKRMGGDWSGPGVLSGSESGARMQGQSRNLGDLCVSSLASVREGAAEPQMHRVVADKPGYSHGANQPHATRYRKPRDAGGHGKDTEKSELLIEPMKPGNQDPKGLGGGKEGPGSHNRRRDRWQVHGHPETSQRNKHG